MLTATTNHKSKFDILKQVKGISSNERLTFFSNGVVSAIDVLMALVSDNENPQTDIMIATWQLGIRDAGHLKILAQKDNINLKILLDVSYKDRNPKYFGRVKSGLGNIVWLTSNHTKVMLISARDKNFVVLSSANFNRNFRFEFFDITESGELYGKVLQNFEPFLQGEPIDKDANNRPVVKEKFKSVFLKEDDGVERNLRGCAHDDLIFQGVEIELPEIELNFDR